MIKKKNNKKIPFEKDTIKEYLDRSIRHWRKKRQEEDMI